MKKIVVPVNFSPSSDNAARYAVDMARAIGASLHLVHVLQMTVSTAEIAMTEYLFEEIQDSAGEGLKQLREELVKRTDDLVPVFTHIEVGALEYRLKDFCAANIPFVVIMGNAGSSLKRDLVGSNLAGAIGHLPYPLIVVPADAVFHSIKRVILACDLDDITGGIPVASSFLRELRDCFGSSFEVINICMSKNDDHNEAETAFEFKCWKDRLHNLYPEVHFLRMNKVEEGIGKYLDDHPADLLLVFPKKYNWFEFHASRSKKIALHSTVPVMSIHN